MRNRKILGILLTGLSLSLFFVNHAAASSESRAMARLLDKYAKMDFGSIKRYSALRDIEKDIFNSLNASIAASPIKTSKLWEEKGAEIQRRLADRALTLASFHQRKTKGTQREDKENAYQAIQCRLLAAQSKRWAAYIPESLREVPYTIIKFSEGMRPDEIQIHSSEREWCVDSRIKRFRKEFILNNPSYLNIWNVEVPWILDLARKTHDLAAMNDIRAWLLKYRDSKLDSSGKSKMFRQRYYDSKNKQRWDDFIFYIKQIPDAELSEINNAIKKVEDEIKVAKAEFQRWYEEQPCKPMGEDISVEGWTEELRCTDLAY